MWWLNTGCTKTKRVKHLGLKNFCFIFQPYIKSPFLNWNFMFNCQVKSSQFYFDYCKNWDYYHLLTQEEFCYWVEMCNESFWNEDFSKVFSDFFWFTLLPLHCMHVSVTARGHKNSLDSSFWVNAFSLSQCIFVLHAPEYSRSNVVSKSL